MTIERPTETASNLAPEWGSDVIALTLRNLGLKYVSLNPGASYRGLHDSLVNFLGNEMPQMILCLHEEHAVAIAHGYAKVTGEPMAVALHSNVGLMHATMAIFDAWCDRAPVVLLGATGPVDAARRRPWIDWIHTARDQGALIRDFIKWDDQPASPEAAIESIYRAGLIARTAPRGPVYLNFDVSLQEAALETPVVPPDASRFAPAAPSRPSAQAVGAAADLLLKAKHPLILAGRVSRDRGGWDARVELAERLGARVLTDRKAAAAFPTDHPLHAAPPVTFMTPGVAEILRGADAILALDWIDLAGTMAGAWKEIPPVPVIHASLDQYSHNGWSMDHQGLPPVDVPLLVEPEAAIADLLDVVRKERPDRPALPARTAAPDGAAPSGDLVVSDIARGLREAVRERPVTLIRASGGWPVGAWHFREPLDYLGVDGGGGIGSGPGISVGAALALKGSDRLPVAVLGDGDYLMGVNALWTAAHYQLPLLIVVANNRSYFNDEVHQDRIARARGRNPDNRWIGQRIADPEPDLAKLADAQGLTGIGPVTDRAGLAEALTCAVAAVEDGGACVVDVRVTPQIEAAAASRAGKHG
jgi:thiamine pyrophosphate-dependent acetolactate synthase large subunit-like protein